MLSLFDINIFVLW